MVTLVRGRPLATREPRIVVDGGMPAGGHRFQLEVVDSAGLRSQPSLARVQVAGRPTPTPGPNDPPIRAVTPRRRRGSGDPSEE